MLKILFLLLFSTVTLASEKENYIQSLISQAKAQNLATDVQWLKLMHYQKRLFGGYKSQADGLAFFLSKEGKTNPESELAATLEAFFSEKQPKPGFKEFADQHPQCLFPARFSWLEEKLHFDKKLLPKQNCEYFSKFKNSIQAKSATVVFSSYYLNNPSSGFGHTFLRLNKAPVSFTGTRYELLDYGISYAANVTVSNPVLYALYGVLGMFPGSLTSLPYYYKVREYNDYESRDLWEYNLSLNEKQIARLVEHLWELGSTYFDYYYLSENCSYHVLTLLESANPELDLISRLPSIVIPVDTIRILVDTPGLLNNISYRPSIRVLFEERVKKLSSDQLNELDELIADFENPKTKDVDVLDAGIDYWDLKNQKDLLDSKSESMKVKRKLLSYRSKFSQTAKKIEISIKESAMPHLGHQSAFVGLSYGNTKNVSQFTELQFRLALQDLLDSRVGYPPYAQIEFVSTKLRFHFDRQDSEDPWFRLEDFSFLKVASLSNFSRYSKSPSWNVKLGAKTLRDNTCTHCISADLGGGAGFTFKVFEKLQFVSMLDVEMNSTPKIKPFWLRVGAGPTAFFRFMPNDNFTSILRAAYRARVPTYKTHYFETSLEGRWAILRNLALNLKWQKYPDTKQFPWELSGGLLYYF